MRVLGRVLENFRLMKQREVRALLATGIESSLWYLLTTGL